MRDLFVGVDLGGSTLRALALDRRGRAVRAHCGPSVPPEKLGPALKKIWKGWGVDHVRALRVGSKGTWKAAPRHRVLASLKGLADRTEVLSDVETAYLNILGERPGLLLLAGTGSIALARDRRGRWHRAGGLGPARGDEGSAFWIGKEYRRRVLGKPSGLSPAAVRETAAIARLVLRWAPGDRRCREILEEAVSHLFKTGEAARRAARLGFPLAAGWGGGLLGFPAVRRRLQRLWGRRVHWRSARRTAERHAALRALGEGR